MFTPEELKLINQLFNQSNLPGQLSELVTSIRKKTQQKEEEENNGERK